MRAETAPRASRLIMLSGGIDSTYLLKHALTETDDDVIVHHVHIVNNEGRDEAEARACRTIVEYCRREFRMFRYSESLVNRSGFKAPGFDVITVASEAGIAATNYLLQTGRMPDHWMIGVNEEEMNEIDAAPWTAQPSSPQSETRLTHVLAAIAATCFPNRPPRYFVPAIKPKRELVEYLGPELADMCWTCRRPQKTSTGFAECGECKTCALMRDIREEAAA